MDDERGSLASFARFQHIRLRLFEFSSGQFEPAAVGTEYLDLILFFIEKTPSRLASAPGAFQGPFFFGNPAHAWLRACT